MVKVVDKDTGEVMDTTTASMVQVKAIDLNFDKIWLHNVLTSIDLIGNQKMRFAFWLIDQRDSNNKINLTMKQMAAQSGISERTVYRTVAALMETDFLRRDNIATYYVNPEFIFRGGNKQRMDVLFRYENIVTKKTDDIDD